MRYRKDNKELHRKCSYCGEYFYISNENINDAIYYDKKTYHSSCFINICKKRSQMKREDVSQKWILISNNLESIKQDSCKHFKTTIIKEDIFKFIKDTYDIILIPTTVWQKLNNIYNGTFKGMFYGIPPEHLLDMWKRKLDMLNGIANRNNTIGKTMDTEQRINYDLSILVNKYDSYLKWLEKQKILDIDKGIERNENIVSKTMGHTAHRTVNDNSDDISSLVDDIFG